MFIRNLFSSVTPTGLLSALRFTLLGPGRQYRGDIGEILEKLYRIEGEIVQE